MPDPSQIPLSALQNQETSIPQDASAKTEAKLLQSTIMVNDEGEEFEFDIPTVRQEIRISSMIPRIRRLADPESAGEGMDGLDPSGYFYIRAIATFLACLKSTDAKWVYAPGKDGKPVIQWENWPAGVTERVLKIALAFQEEVSRFHGGGAAQE